MVLKRNSSGGLDYSHAHSAEYAVDQFKTTLEKFVKSSRGRRGTVRKLETWRLKIDATSKTSPIKGLTGQENRELEHGGKYSRIFSQTEVASTSLSREMNYLRSAFINFMHKRTRFRENIYNFSSFVFEFLVVF